MKILIKRFVMITLCGVIFGLSPIVAFEGEEEMQLMGPMTMQEIQSHLETTYLIPFIANTAEGVNYPDDKEKEMVQKARIARLVHSLAYGVQNLSEDKLANLFTNPESKIRAYLQQIVLDTAVHGIFYTDYTAENIFGTDKTMLCKIFEDYFAGIFVARPRILKSDTNTQQTKGDFFALVENVGSLLLSTSKCWSNALVIHKENLEALQHLIGSAVRQYAYLENQQPAAIQKEMESRSTGYWGALLKPYYGARLKWNFPKISQDGIETAMRAYYQQSLAQGKTISYPRFVNQVSEKMIFYMTGNPNASNIIAQIRVKAERGLFKRAIYSLTDPKKLVFAGAVIVVTGGILYKNREVIKKVYTEQGLKAVLLFAAATTGSAIKTTTGQVVGYIQATAASGVEKAYKLWESTKGWVTKHGKKLWPTKAARERTWSERFREKLFGPTPEPKKNWVPNINWKFWKKTPPPTRRGWLGEGSQAGF